MKTIAIRIRHLYETRPLLVIMVIAAALRLWAAVFARGYGMHDDHFCVIEIAQRWANGHNDWFAPQDDHIRSIIYPGAHYLLFRILGALGMLDPQAKMLVVRLLHAAYSLLYVYFGYLLTARVAGRNTARKAGLLLAAFWLAPFMSVRNLIEFVCIPPLVIGTYLLHKSETGERWSAVWRGLACAGCMFGFAFVLRFQTLAMAATVGFLLLLGKKWHQTIAFGTGFLATVFCVQGVSDWLAYGYPFASFWEYLKYNAANANNYTTGPWHRYLSLVAGVLIPPTSLLILYGFGRMWRKLPFIFWPTVVYFVLHSLFPNKQERFILPVLPFILILGVAGWEDLAGRSTWRPWAKRTARGLWGWFYTVNVLLLVGITGTYSKKARVESMYSLCRLGDAAGVVVESAKESVQMAPRFYLGGEEPVFYLPKTKSIDGLRAEIDSAEAGEPNYLVLSGDGAIEQRLQRLAPLWHKIEYVKQVSPGLLDRIMYRINPKHNVNETARIYRIAR